MGRPRLGSSDVATPTRVLDAAEAAFAAEGYEAASLAAIAATAGIRRPSLLYHFATKELLYAATVERAFGRLGIALAPSMEPAADFGAQLCAMARAYRTFVSEHRAVARLILREILDGQGPGRAILLRRIVPLLDRIEDFCRGYEGAGLRPGLPVRAAIMRVAADMLLWASASDDLRAPLWGDDDPTDALVRAQFLS